MKSLKEAVTYNRDSFQKNRQMGNVLDKTV